jgi:hypothetical protein
VGEPHESSSGLTGGVTIMISAEQELSDSLNALMAKKYGVFGSSPLIVAGGVSTD